MPAPIPRPGAGGRQSAGQKCKAAVASCRRSSQENCRGGDALIEDVPSLSSCWPCSTLQRQHAAHVMLASSGASVPCALTAHMPPPVSSHCQSLSCRGRQEMRCSRWKAAECTRQPKPFPAPYASQCFDAQVVVSAAVHARPSARTYAAGHLPVLSPPSEVVATGKLCPVCDARLLGEQGRGCRQGCRAGAAGRRPWAAPPAPGQVSQACAEGRRKPRSSPAATGSAP